MYWGEGIREGYSPSPTPILPPPQCREPNPALPNHYSQQCNKVNYCKPCASSDYDYENCAQQGFPSDVCKMSFCNRPWKTGCKPTPKNCCYDGEHVYSGYAGEQLCSNPPYTVCKSNADCGDGTCITTGSGAYPSLGGL